MPGIADWADVGWLELAEPIACAFLVRWRVHAIEDDGCGALALQRTVLRPHRSASAKRRAPVQHCPRLALHRLTLHPDSQPLQRFRDRLTHRQSFGRIALTSGRGV